MIDLPTDTGAQIAVLSSLGRFRTLPETAGMQQWLRDGLLKLDAANRIELDEATLRQRQGACQTLEAIIRYVDTADKLAEKIRANHQRKGV